MQQTAQHFADMFPPPHTEGATKHLRNTLGALAAAALFALAGCSGGSDEDAATKAKKKAETEAACATAEAYVNVPDKDEHTPLMKAAYRGDEKGAKCLIEKGADVNYMNSFTSTPLSFAVQEDHADVAKLLLKKGAKVDVTVLERALKNTSADVVQLLFESKNVHEDGKWSTSKIIYGSRFSSDPRCRFDSRYCARPLIPIILASENFRHPEVVQYLVKNGAKADDTVDGYTALDAALRTLDALTDNINNINNSKLSEEEKTKKKEGLEKERELVRKGSVSIIRTLLDNGVNASSGMNEATAIGDIEIVKLLLDKGANASAGLDAAISRGNTQMVKLLLERGATASSANLDSLLKSSHSNAELFAALVKSGVTIPPDALFTANNAEAVKLLLENGAQVDAKSDDGLTPLMHAVIRGNIEVARVLLDKGASVSAQNGRNENVLSMALNRCRDNSNSEKWENSLGVLQVLVEKSDNTDVLPRALWQVIDESWYDSQNRQTEIARLLLDKGADFNAIIDDAKDSVNTPFKLAFAKGAGSIIDLMVAKGADVKSLWGGRHEQAEILFRSISNGKLGAVKLLLEHGADANTTIQGKSALQRSLDGAKQAVYSQRQEQKKDMLPLDAWKEALEKGSVPEAVAITKLLLDKGADPNHVDQHGDVMLTGLAEQGHTELIVLFLDKNADVNLVNKIGWTPLLAAAIANENAPDSARLLLDKGADINIAHPHRGTAISIAVKKEKANPALVQLLLDKGANANTLLDERSGTTLLIHAIKELRHHYFDERIKAFTSITRALIEKGADVNAPDKTGATPLMYAANNNSEEIVKLLIEKGANVNAVSNAKQTALEITGSAKIRDMLEAAGAKEQPKQ